MIENVKGLLTHDEGKTIKNNNHVSDKRLI
jgi:site-specific DNA-cytosine methylase